MSAGTRSRQVQEAADDARPARLTHCGRCCPSIPPQKREGDPSSHATRSRETERNPKCPVGAQPMCHSQRSFSGVTVLKTHRQLLCVLLFWLKMCSKKRCLWMHNQDCGHFASPTVKYYFSNWAFKKERQLLLWYNRTFNSAAFVCKIKVLLEATMLM